MDDRMEVYADAGYAHASLQMGNAVEKEPNTSGFCARIKRRCSGCSAESDSATSKYCVQRSLAVSAATPSLSDFSGSA